MPIPEIIPQQPDQICEIGIVADESPNEPTFGLVAKLIDGRFLCVKCLKTKFALVESFIKTLDVTDPHNYAKLIRYLRSQGFKESFGNPRPIGS